LICTWKPLLNVEFWAQSGIAVYLPGATLGPRILKSFEFVWIIEGDVKARFDKHEIDAPPGTILLARQGMSDYYRWAVHHKTTHAYFHFKFDLPKDGGWPPVEEWPVVRYMPQDDILRPLFRYFLSASLLEEPIRTSILVSTLNLMFQSFVSGHITTQKEHQPDLPAPVDKVLRRIQEITFQNPPTSPTLKQLAQIGHVTSEHLCRLFQKTLQLSPIECVRLAKLERATTLLAQTNLAVNQVADQMGFVSPYHFSREFRKVYGYSPRSYRRAIQDGKYIRPNPIFRALPVSVLRN
jgi:AraC family transcriptional regulator